MLGKRGILIVGLALCGPAWANSSDYRSAAYTPGAYASAPQRPLAEQGYPAAQNSLGIKYRDGQGVAQDFIESVKWFRLAANQGYDDAQFNLALMYDEGRGVAKDRAQAVKWFRLAADQGLPDAQNNLGVRYDNGVGVARDYVQAYKWFDLAASGFPASDRENRDRAVRNRGIVAAKMTPAQIAEAQRLSHEWKPK
jgi:TPR repeat protein